jgi:hypothetical protein
MSEPIAKAMLVCNYATQDAKGRYSLIEIFDSIHPPGFPHYTGFILYTLIADPPAKGTMVVQVEDDNGIALWTSGHISFFTTDPSVSWMATCQRVGPVSFVSYGKCRVAVYVGAYRAGDLELRISPPAIPDAARKEIL